MLLTILKNIKHLPVKRILAVVPPVRLLPEEPDIFIVH